MTVARRAASFIFLVGAMGIAAHPERNDFIRYTVATIFCVGAAMFWP